MRSVIRRLFGDDLIQHSSLVFAAVIAVNAGNYFFQVVASRILDVREFGALVALITLANLLTIPAWVVLTTLARMVAEYHSTEERGQVRRLVDLSVIVCVGLGTAMALAIALSANLISRYLRIPDENAIYATALFIGLSTVIVAFRGPLQGLQAFKGSFFSSAVDGAARAVFGVGGVMLGFGVRGVMWGLAMSTIPTLLASRMALANKIRVAPARLGLALSRVVHTIGGVTVFTVCFLVLSGVDVIIVKHFFDPRTAGLYGALSLIGRIVYFALTFVSQIVLPAAANRIRHSTSPLPVLARGLALVAIAGACALLVSMAVPVGHRQGRRRNRVHSRSALRRCIRRRHGVALHGQRCGYV